MVRDLANGDHSLEPAIAAERYAKFHVYRRLQVRQRTRLAKKKGGQVNQFTIVGFGFQDSDTLRD